MRGLFVRDWANLHAVVLQPSQTIDFAHDGVARFQPQLRVTGHSNARRCACKDQVTRCQGEDVGQIGDQLRDLEDQLSSRRILYCFSVENTTDAKSVWIANFV